MSCQILINVFISEWKYKQEICIFFFLSPHPLPPLFVYATVMSFGSAPLPPPLLKSLTTSCFSLLERENVTAKIFIK